MQKTTLDQFLADEYQRKNEWVTHPGFSGLYVRKGYIIDPIERKIVENCVTIANVTVTHPGKGIFTKLVSYLESKGYSIFVESVHEPRLQDKLVRLGFVYIGHLNYLKRAS